MHINSIKSYFCQKDFLRYYCPPDWQLKCKDDLILIENSAKFPPGGGYLQKWRPVFGVSGRPNLCYFGKFHLYLYQNNGKCLQKWVKNTFPTSYMWWENLLSDEKILIITKYWFTIIVSIKSRNHFCFCENPGTKIFLLSKVIISLYYKKNCKIEKKWLK